MTKRFGRATVIGISIALTLLAPTSAAAQTATTPPWRTPLEPAPHTVDVVVGNTTLSTELAITGNQQRLGLGYRNQLGAESAMLFANEEASPKSFWMKGMRFCLDIIWIEGGKIVGAAENFCPDPDGTADQDRARVFSPEPVTYVLEVNAGWLTAHGYGVGTEVTIPELPSF